MNVIDQLSFQVWHRYVDNFQVIEGYVEHLPFELFSLWVRNAWKFPTFQLINTVHVPVHNIGGELESYHIILFIVGLHPFTHNLNILEISFKPIILYSHCLHILFMQNFLQLHTKVVVVAHNYVQQAHNKLDLFYKCCSQIFTVQIRLEDSISASLVPQD